MTGSSAKRASAAALLLSLVAACGKVAPAPVDSAEWHSGSRLRARVLDAGDGARAFEEWVDGTTGQPCTFVTAEDGVTRCLPALENGILFEDTACQAPVEIVAPSSTEPAPEWLIFDFLGPESDAVCATWPVRAGRVTHPSSAKTFYYRGFGGTCDPSTSTIDGTAMSVELVAPDAFVGAHETTREPTAGLASVVREADDGSWQAMGVKDVSRGAGCGSYSSRSGDRRCVPNEHIGWRTGHYFADAACTDDVAYTACDTPDIVYSDDPGDCSDSHLFSIVKPIDGPGYMTQGGECVLVTWEDHVFFHYGEQPLDAFPAIEDVDVGKGRVKIRRWGAGGVALSGNGTLVDTSTDTDCLVRRGDDIRCTPGYTDAAQLSGAFTDSACTLPLFSTRVYQELHGAPGGACGAASGPPPAPFTIGITSDTSSGATEYHQLGDEWTGDLYAPDASSICAPTIRDATLHYLVPGPVIDPTTFPLLTELVE